MPLQSAGGAPPAIVISMTDTASEKADMSRCQKAAGLFFSLGFDVKFCDFSFTDIARLGGENPCRERCLAGGLSKNVHV